MRSREHLSYWITQCYLPPDRGDSHAFNSAIAVFDVCKRRTAFNSVINCSFFYYICCFSIFTSNFIVSGSCVLICNAQATTSSTRPFDSPYHISYRYSIATIFATLGPKHIGVTALAFLGHVTSSVT